jgi:AcrR family transcriptional regulator
MDNTQYRLLEAAGEVFAERGYEAATVREICRRAEVGNIAAVNYHFGDKEKLYIAAVQQAFCGSAPAGIVPEWPAGTPPATKLREFIRHFVEGLIGTARPCWHLQLMSRELTQPSAACVAFVRNYAEPHFRALLAILSEVVPPEVSEQKRHLLALSIIGQCVHHRCARAIITQIVGEAEAATYTAERLAEHIAEFSLAALGLTAAPEHCA